MERLSCSLTADPILPVHKLPLYILQLSTNLQLKLKKHLQNDSAGVSGGRNGKYVEKGAQCIELECVLNIRMGHAAGHLRSMERSRNRM